MRDEGRPRHFLPRSSRYSSRLQKSERRSEAQGNGWPESQDPDARISIRFTDTPLHERLKKMARLRGVSISTLAQRLIDEGLRMENHPLIHFRQQTTGRYPALVGGPLVVWVVDMLIGGDVPTEQRRARTADLMNLSLAQVDAALAYYAEFTDEIDEDIAERKRISAEMEAAWLREQELLAT